MAPPTKPPSTPQSNTLLNYFNRSVVKTPTTPSTSTTTGSSPGASANRGGGGGGSQSSQCKKDTTTPTATLDSTPSNSKVNNNGEESDSPKKTPAKEYDGETPKKSKVERKTPRRPRRIVSSEDDEENQSPKEEENKDKEKKKRKVAKKKVAKDDNDDDDEMDEYKPSNEEDEDYSSEEYSGEMSEEDEDEVDSEEPSPSPSSSKKKKSGGGTRMKRKSVDSPAAEPASHKKLKTQFGPRFIPPPPPPPSPPPPASSPPIASSGSFSASRKGFSAGVGGGLRMTFDKHDGDGIQWPHLQWEWLKPEKRRDANKRLMSDENYDPTTLDVPTSFLNEQTPVHRQWWELKRKYFDTVLLFKMGKFYELFHMDSVTAVKELDIIFMKGEYAHSGFPEKSYSKHANKLIDLGYKVARIEQTETPEMMNERNKANKQKGRVVQKYDHVVNREVCQISTRGVRISSVQDDPKFTPFNPESTYLYCVKQKAATSGCPDFGVCFIDTTIGEFHLGQFQDDRYFSRLRTLFSHCPPAHVLLQRGNVMPQVDQLISNFAGIRKETFNSHFPTHDKVLARLREDNYFGETSTGDIDWPDALKTITDSGQLTAADGWELAWQAFGFVIQYLKKCFVDHDLLSLKRFSIYRPVDSILSSDPNDVPLPSNMVLDGITLRNLDITENESSNSNFTLLGKVNKCYTAFGKRLVREWICMPLAVPREIEIRLDAIEELFQLDELCKAMPLHLRLLPDLERLLNKIHTLGSAYRKQNHPDGRAIMFEEVTYSKNKIVDLISIIKGFKDCVQLIKLLRDEQPKSKFLLDIATNFPDLRPTLAKFDTAFDQVAAKKEGKIIPKDGVDSEYDKIQADLAEATLATERYLREARIHLKVPVKYFGSAKNRFQLEVPAGAKVPDEFELSSSRKGFKRYVNSATKGLLDDIMRVETKREEVLRDITRRIFEKFDKSYENWKIAVDCIAKLDAILCLKTFSASQEGMCRPKVVYSKKPFIKIKDGRHPCISIDAYITNSCYLGVGRPNKLPPFGSFMLLTGPNMGGKSTLMRQVALTAVLAQMGCHVPAASCEMSVVDRIFTRIGASDNLAEGESTFFVELSETSSILRHCTKNSLVLMDELGRGTATYDGTAIAHAVANNLATRGIRSLFSTHYHTLVESIQHLPMIQLGHMACMVENESDDPTEETVTFLYKIAPGQCPKSYGFNAAKLAGMPEEVIRCGYQKAKEFESAANHVDAFRKTLLMITENNLSLRSAMQLLKL